MKIFYEDNHLLVVEKDYNMLCQSDNTGDINLLDELKKYVKNKYNKPNNVYIGLVHRLDRPVGGIMVFARTSKAASRLSKLIREHNMKKIYLLVCHGKFNEISGQYNDKILKQDDFKSIISDKGKESLLYYRVLDYNKDKDESLVMVDLVSGRHHQIRVEFSYHGHHIVGDNLYGKCERVPISLYCYRIEFIHPTLKNKMDFCNIPNYSSFCDFNIKELLK